jgi:hypothetical protein
VEPVKKGGISKTVTGVVCGVVILAAISTIILLGIRRYHHYHRQQTLNQPIQMQSLPPMVSFGARPSSIIIRSLSAPSLLNVDTSSDTNSLLSNNNQTISDWRYSSVKTHMNNAFSTVSEIVDKTSNFANDRCYAFSTLQECSTVNPYLDTVESIV